MLRRKSKYSNQDTSLKVGGYPYPSVTPNRVNRLTLFNDVQNDYIKERANRKLPAADALLGWVRCTIRNAEKFLNNSQGNKNNTFCEDVACFAALWEWVPEVALVIFLQVTEQNSDKYFISNLSLIEWQKSAQQGGGGGKFVCDEQTIDQCMINTYNKCLHIASRYYKNKGRIPLFIDVHENKRVTLYNNILPFKKKIMNASTNKSDLLSMMESAYDTNTPSKESIYSKNNLSLFYPDRLITLITKSIGVTGGNHQNFINTYKNTEQLICKIDLARFCLGKLCNEISTAPTQKEFEMRLKEFTAVVNLGIFDINSSSQGQLSQSNAKNTCIACFISKYSAWQSSEFFLYVPMSPSNYNKTHTRQSSDNPMIRQLNFVIQQNFNGLKNVIPIHNDNEMKILGGFYKIKN